MTVDEVAVVILAGGASRRMGEPKLVLRHAGETLLARAILTARAVSSRVSVVVGAYPELYGEQARRLGAAVVTNTAWDEGLASSLQQGVAALSDDIEAALILLGDQPFVAVHHARALVARYRETAAELVFSSYQGVLGAPTVIARGAFDKVDTLKGDVGAKALIPLVARVEELPLETFEDIDTPDDRSRLLES